MKTNLIENNQKLPLLTQLIAGWHHDRNLITGLARPQVIKLFEEFTEVVAAITQTNEADGVYDEVLSMLDDLHARNRLKPVVAGKSRAAMHDALGDMFVLLVNLAEKDNVSLSSCVDGAWSEIKDRKGKIINGIFVKEEDL